MCIRAISKHYGGSSLLRSMQSKGGEYCWVYVHGTWEWLSFGCCEVYKVLECYPVWCVAGLGGWDVSNLVTTSTGTWLPSETRGMMVNNIFVPMVCSDGKQIRLQFSTIWKNILPLSCECNIMNWILLWLHVPLPSGMLYLDGCCCSSSVNAYTYMDMHRWLLPHGLQCHHSLYPAAVVGEVPKTCAKVCPG